MAHEASPTTHNTNKRKRGPADSDAVRVAPGFTKSAANAGSDESMEPYAVDESAISQLIAHNNQDEDSNGGNPASASDTAAAALSHYQMGGGPSGASDSPVRSGDAAEAVFNRIMNELEADKQAAEAASGKPRVGSDEWHKVRRDNHKEVERRRRETINEGINELQKIVPGCEKNKGSILQRAVQYITQLKDMESQNIEKWTLEKLLLDQAINELSASCDRLKGDHQKVWEEKESYKRACENAGIVPEDLKEGEESAPPAE